MITVMLLYPNGQRQDVLLAGVPRTGEHIRLDNGPSSLSLVVEHVMWVEGHGRSPEPEVIVSVREAASPPRG